MGQRTNEERCFHFGSVLGTKESLSLEQMFEWRLSNSKKPTMRMSEFWAFLAKDRQKQNAKANQPPHTLCTQAKAWLLADSLPCLCNFTCDCHCLWWLLSSNSLCWNKIHSLHGFKCNPKVSSFYQNNMISLCPLVLVSFLVHYCIPSCIHLFLCLVHAL